MTVIIYGVRNSVSDLGARYFFTKYGVLQEIIKKLLVIRESGPGNKDPDENDGVLAEISYGNVNLPAFAPPRHVHDHGRILATAHVKGETYPCLIDDGKDVISGIDLFFNIGFSLSGRLEKVWDDLGGGHEKFTRFPFVDIYSDILFKACARNLQRNNQPLIYKSFWPEGKQFAVCLTHDVDEVRKTYQWVTYPLRMIGKKDLSGLKNQCRSLKNKIIHGDEPFWTFPSLMKMEHDLNVRSSFYFLKEKGKIRISDRSTWRHLGRRYSYQDHDVVSLIRAMQAGGWEVGLHGSFYSFLDPGMLRREKEDLERVLESKVIGTRQHNLNLKVPDTWRYQSQVGLSYDSTLGFNHTIGFRWGTCFPFHLFDPESGLLMDLLEIPLSIEEIALLKMKNYQSQANRLTNEVKRAQGVLTLLWHHSAMNNHEFPGYGECYEQIIRSCLERNAWITHGASISEWWSRRESHAYTYEHKDDRILIHSDALGPIYFDCVLPEGMRMRTIRNATVISQGDTITIRSEKGRISDISIELEELKSAPSQG